MKDCRICGEHKTNKEFRRLKYFGHVQPQKVIWCKDCQKMFMKMKAEEKKKENLQEIKLSGLVEFV